MGLTESKNIAKTVVKAMSKISSEIIQKTDIGTQSSQIISVQDIEGDVVIKGNKQMQNVDLNMQSLLSALSTEESQQNLAAELAQEAKSLTSGLNLAQFSEATNIMDLLISASIEIMSNIEQSCQLKSMQYQKILINRVKGDVRVEDNIQDQVANIFEACTQSTVNNSKTIQDVSAKLTQTASATASGLSPLALFALLIGVPVVGGIVGVKYIFPICVVFGIVAIVVYYVNVEENMVMNAYSTLIHNSPLCDAQVVVDDDTSYPNPVNAANACKGNSQCKAFDWKIMDINQDGTYTMLDEAKTTFYSSVNTDCQNSLKKDNVRMVKPAQIIFGLGPPTLQTELNKPNKTVYIDSDTTQWYELRRTDDTTQGKYELKGTIFHETFNTPAIISEVAIPHTQRPKENDLYIYYNKNNPAYFHVSQYKGGSWIDKERVPGPGMITNVPSVTNGSGFKIQTRKDFLLYAGSVAIVAGFVGMIITRKS